MFALLTLAATALATPTLDVDGACPGPVTVEITDATPGARLVLLGSSAGVGSDPVPAGPCRDTATGLRRPTKVAVFTARVDGSVVVGPTLSPPACTKTLQVLDLDTCEVSGTVALSGPAEAPPCEGGADQLAVAPGEDMVVCDDPGDVTCEEDFEALCPLGWHLCTMDEYNGRNDGWADAMPDTRALGVIYCRPGESGAGHFTVPDSGSPFGSLGDDEVFNCYFGSSRDSCVAGYGCNERSATALCCAPSRDCGNGVVDGPEEQCDDGDLDDTDDCLSSCTWRIPTEHGFSGTNCG